MARKGRVSNRYALLTESLLRFIRFFNEGLVRLFLFLREARCPRRKRAAGGRL